MTADPPLPGLRRTGFTDFTDKESVSIPIPNRDKETKTQRGKPQPKNLNRRKPRKQRYNGLTRGQNHIFVSLMILPNPPIRKRLKTGKRNLGVRAQLLA